MSGEQTRSPNQGKIMVKELGIRLKTLIEDRSKVNATLTDKVVFFIHYLLIK